MANNHQQPTVDLNVYWAYELANMIGPPPAFPSSLDTIVQRVKFVDYFNLAFMSNTRLWETIGDPKWLCEFIEKIWFRTKGQLPDIHSGSDRVNISLRLWAGCTSSSKMIRFTSVVKSEYDIMTNITCEIVVTHGTRANESTIIDEIANNDHIYKAGVEAGPEFKKAHKQYFSFRGVNVNSVVVNYPNEYLIDTDTKICDEEVDGYKYKRFYWNQ